MKIVENCMAKATAKSIPDKYVNNSRITKIKQAEKKQ